jgi:hypothetical protein
LPPKDGSPPVLSRQNSALNFQILGRRLSLVRRFFILDNLPFTKPAETGALYHGDMDKYIFAAALRLYESISLSAN